MDPTEQTLPRVGMTPKPSFPPEPTWRAVRQKSAAQKNKRCPKSALPLEPTRRAVRPKQALPRVGFAARADLASGAVHRADKLAQCQSRSKSELLSQRTS